MTNRLFDFDGYCLSFTAKVLECEAQEDGFAVVLDATAFAPEGGGQRSDIGFLDGAEVVDAWMRDGVIYHRTKTPLAVGKIVLGQVDRARRIRHIQNHTGEHIVSGILHEKYGYDNVGFHNHYGFNNVGFHLGSEDVTLDLDGTVDESMLRAIEREANEIVVSNVVVQVAYPDAETLASLSYRAKLDLTEDVRIVTIEGVDACACCAPHVNRTGEIGMIKLISAMRYKGGTRIHMKCGFDALGEYYAKAIHAKYGDDFDVLFGPAYKGIPLAVVTAIAYSDLFGKEVRYCSDRKEEKDHGADKGSFLGSSLKDGDRVIMIEDVTTSGKSMEETVPKVRGAADVEIVGLMVSLNRQEVGKSGNKVALDEVKELYGFETAAIVSMDEVVECLYNKEVKGQVVIDDALKAAIDAYYEQYGAK